MVTGVLKRAERKCVDKIGWLQILTFEKCTVTLKEWIWLRLFYRNNCSTSERTHSWNQHFLEISILLLKELLKQWMTASSSVNINTVHFKDSHSFCDKNRCTSSRDGLLELE